MSNQKTNSKKETIPLTMKTLDARMTILEFNNSVTNDLLREIRVQLGTILKGRESDQSAKQEKVMNGKSIEQIKKEPPVDGKRQELAPLEPQDMYSGLSKAHSKLDKLQDLVKDVMGKAGPVLRNAPPIQREKMKEGIEWTQAFKELMFICEKVDNLTDQMHYLQENLML